MDISKNAINNRFKESVEELLLKTPSLNKKLLAEKLNIGQTKFSEILNNRMNVSAELLANYCILYSVDINWVLTGNFIYKSEDGTHLVSESKADYEGIKFDDAMVERVLNENKLLKSQLDVLQTVLKEKQDIIDAFRSGSIIITDTSDK